MIDDINYHMVQYGDSCLIYDVNASRLFKISSKAGKYLENVKNQTEFTSIIEYLRRNKPSETLIQLIDFETRSWLSTGKLEKLTLNVTYQFDVLQRLKPVGFWPCKR